MIIGLQLVGIAFSLVMIYLAVIHFKKKDLSMQEIIIWFFAWLFAIIATIFPDLLQVFAKTFLFARLFDMMVVGAILLIMAMTAKTYMSTRKMEKRLESLVRKDSLKNGKEKAS